MSQATVSAPAKVILFGEHFVVYGNPAILAAIDKRISVHARILSYHDDKIVIRSDIGVTGEYKQSGDFFKALEGGDRAKAVLDPLYGAVRQVLSTKNNKKVGIEVNILSTVPLGIGLGSSAASCVATVAAVDLLFEKNINRQRVCEIAIESERQIHNRTSGADCYISTFGGLIQYHGKSKSFENIERKGSLPLVVASTGIKHKTSDLVVAVNRFKEENKIVFESLAKQARDICLQALSAIKSGNGDRIGELMYENQILLQQIGISHESARAIIDICNKAGAIGAKITGAGGGGAIVALASSKLESIKIASQLKEAGYQAFEVEIDYTGLSI